MSESSKPSYFDLLQKVETLLQLSTKLNISPDQAQESLDISEMETIFKHVAAKIDPIIGRMSFQRRSMVLVMVLNTITRVAANDVSSLVITHDPFQSMYRKIICYVHAILEDEDYSPASASDLLNSMLVNLVKDGFAEICFKRLLSNEKESTLGNIVHSRGIEM